MSDPEAVTEYYECSILDTYPKWIILEERRTFSCRSVIWKLKTQLHFQTLHTLSASTGWLNKCMWISASQEQSQQPAPRRCHWELSIHREHQVGLTHSSQHRHMQRILLFTCETGFYLDAYCTIWTLKSSTYDFNEKYCDTNQKKAHVS